MANKRSQIYHNSTVLWYIFWLSGDNVLQLAIAGAGIARYNVSVLRKHLYFHQRQKNRSVVSFSRIHSKNSKVVNNPKNHIIFTTKVVAHPKFTPKNISKWLQHTKYRIQYHHKYVCHTKTITVRIKQTKIQNCPCYTHTYFWSKYRIIYTYTLYITMIQFYHII